MENNTEITLELFQNKCSKKEFKAYLNLQFDFLVSTSNSDTIDMVQFYDFTNFPLPVAQKLFNSFSFLAPNLSRRCFINGLTKLYLGSFEEKIDLLILLFDFTQSDMIYVENIKLLVTHFHHYEAAHTNYEQLIEHFDLIFNNIKQFTRKEMEDYIKVYPDIFYYFFINFILRTPFDDVSIAFYNKHIKHNTQNSSNRISPKSKTNPLGGFHLSDFLSQYFSHAIVRHTIAVNEDEDLNDLNNFETDICNVKCKMTQAFSRNTSLSSNSTNDDDSKTNNSASTLRNAFSSLMHLSGMNSSYSYNFSSSSSQGENQTNNANDKVYESIIGSFSDEITKTIINAILYVINDDLYVFSVNSNNEESGFHSFISLKHLFIDSSAKQANDDRKHSVYLLSQISFSSIRYHFSFNSKEEAENFVKIIHKATHFRKIADHYDESSVINRGSFGIVYKYKHKKSKKLFACKVLLKSTSNNNYQYAYKMEAYLCGLFSKMDHSGIAKYYDIFEDDQALYIIQKYYSQGNLGDYYQANNNYLQAEIMNNILKQITCSMHFLRKFGIVHRDLKIDNVLYSHNQTKIIDFGLSAIIGKGETLADRCGTIKYFSPEVIQGLKYNFLVDIWSLGMIGYFLYYGKFPYENNHSIQSDYNIFDKILFRDYHFPSRLTPAIKNEKIPLALKKCLEKDTNDRITIDHLYNDRNLLFFSGQ